MNYNKQKGKYPNAPWGNKVEKLEFDDLSAGAKTLSTNLMKIKEAFSKGIGSGIKQTFSSLGLVNSILAVTAAVSAGITVWNAYQQAQEAARQKAAESADVYSQSANSINDYLTKYQELHQALLAAQGNEQETYNVKQQLLSLQQELNAAYGEEYGKIDLVTNAYKDQAEAIDNKKLGQKYLNENQKEIDKAEKKMTSDRHYEFSAGNQLSAVDRAFLSNVAREYGISAYEDITGSNGTSNFKFFIDADPEKAYEAIDKFMNDVREKYGDDSELGIKVLESASKSLKSANEVIEMYGDIYNQALMAQIANDDELSKTYNDATTAVEEYNNAIIDGDPSKIKEARNNLLDVQKTVENGGSEWDKYNRIFNDVFDEADTRLYDFKEAVTNNTDGLGDLANKFKGLNDVDLGGYADSGDNSKFNELARQADKYDLSVNELIDSLVELGIVQGQIDEQAGKAFNIKATPKLDEYKAALESENSGVNYDSIFSGIETAKNAYDKGLIGTDDFKSFAKLISPNDIDTLSEYEKHIGNIKRYFTEDISGVRNFLTDLSKQTDAAGESMAVWDSNTESWSLNIDDVTKTADKMGLSVESLVAILGKLNEYGIFTGIYNSADEAKNSLVELYSEYNELAVKRDELKDSGNADTSGLDTIESKLAELKGQIDTTAEAYLSLLMGGNGDLDSTADDIVSQIEANQNALSKAVEKYNNTDFSKYGNLSNEAKERMLEGIKKFAAESGYGIGGTDGKLYIDFHAKLDEDSVNNVEDQLNSIKVNDVEIGIDVNKPQDLVKQLMSGAKNNAESGVNVSGTVNLKVNRDAVDAEKYDTEATVTFVPNSATVNRIKRDFQNTVINIPINFITNGKIPTPSSNGGGSEAKGNAQFGTAMANGTIGEKNGGKVLTGELGKELIIRGSHFFTVGDNGAEFVNLRKGDIVFNHRQTEELLSNGHIRSRGRALVKGNAYAGGAGGSGNNKLLAPGKTTTMTTTKTTTTTASNGKSGSDSDKKTNDNFYNYFEAILKDRQKAVEKFEKELEKLNERIEKARENNDIELEKALISEFGQTTKEYQDNLAKSAEELIKTAEEQILPIIRSFAPELAGVTADNFSEQTLLDIQKRVDDKLIELENSGADTKELEYRRKEYEALVDTAQAYYDAVGGKNGEGDFAEKWAESAEKYRDILLGHFDEIEEGYDRTLDTMSQAADNINHEISMMEARGYEANDALKRQLADSLEQQKAINVEKAKGLELELAELVARGAISKNDDEYYDKLETINRVKAEILSLDEEIAKYEKELDEYDRHNSIFENITNAFQTVLNKFNTFASSAYKSFTTKGSAMQKEVAQLNKLMKSTSDEITYQQNVFDSLDIPAEYIEMIKNGSIDPLSIDDVGLSESLQKGVEVWQKICELEQTALDTQEDISSKYKEMFDNAANKYESALNQIELHSQLIEKAISMSEAQGYKTSKSYYDELMSLERDNLSQLEKERADLIKAMKTAVSEGNIEKYSDAWQDMQSEINNVTSAIWDSKQALLEYEKTLRELDWEMFDYLQENISQITSEADFLIDLMSNADMFDDKGKLTDKGLATLGLHGVNYNTYAEEAKKYAEEIKSIEREIDNDPYNTDLLERRNELVKSHQDAILAAENEKQALKDLISKGYDAEIEALEELADKYIDALEAQEDLYEYYKKVKDLTSEISSLEKQLAVYANDTSEEAKAKLQEIKVSLEEAREDLAETQYQQFISDQRKLLDNLIDEYKKTLNTRLDNVDGLIEDVIVNINGNSSNIRETLETVSREVGYTMSDNMAAIWSPLIDETGHITDVITSYSNNMAASMTSLQSVVGGIVTGIDKMIAATDDLAESLLNQAAGDSKEVPAESGSKNSSLTSSDNKANNNSAASSSGKNNSSSNSTSGKMTDNQAKDALAKKYGSKGNILGVYDYLNVGTQDAMSKNDATKRRSYFIFKRNHNYTAYHVPFGDTVAVKDGILGSYARGTSFNPMTGEYLVDENGEELIAHKQAGRVTSLEMGDRVFNARETSDIAHNLEMLADKTLPEILAEQYGQLRGMSVANGNLSTGQILSYMADSIADFDRLPNNVLNTSVPNSISNNNSTNINGGVNISFALPNVYNYKDFIREAQSDAKFERLVQSMTIDRVAGKSSLAKHKVKF